MSTRDQAITILVEKIREIDAEATRVADRQQAAASDPRYFDSGDGYRECADVHRTLAYMCEQIVEDIDNGRLDTLDAEEAEEGASIAPPSGLYLVERDTDIRDGDPS